MVNSGGAEKGPGWGEGGKGRRFEDTMLGKAGHKGGMRCGPRIRPCTTHPGVSHV